MTPCRAVIFVEAGDGNRTRSSTLEGSRITIIQHPHYQIVSPIVGEALGNATRKYEAYNDLITTG